MAQYANAANAMEIDGAQGAEQQREMRVANSKMLKVIEDGFMRCKYEANHSKSVSKNPG